MISRTYPEPRIDVAAQLDALVSPDHPKDVVWLAVGTPLPGAEVPALKVEHEAGTLYTTDPDKAARFEADPSDDTLAALLDYIEPKRAVTMPPAVVQARAPSGGVVLEMLCSGGRLIEAAKRAESHGELFILTVPEAVRRRLDLWTRGL